MFEYRHNSLCKTVWFGEKSAFLTQKTWFHAISRLFSFPTILICKKCTKYNFIATAKFRRNRFSYSNTPKHAQNWLFLAIFSFFLFLRSIFFTLGIKKSPFCSSKCCIKYPKWSNWAISEHKKELWILTKNEIVLYPMHGAPGPDGRRDRGPTEVEPVVRTSTKTLSIDGKCQSWARANESYTREQQVPCDVTLTEFLTLYSANWINQEIILLCLAPNFRPSFNLTCVWELVQ